MEGQLVVNRQSKDHFASLMKETSKKVYQMAYRLSGNAADAEDITQAAFFRAYRSFEEYQGDRPFENWIYRIVTRLYLDLLRYRRRRVKTISYDSPVVLGNGDDTVMFEAADAQPNPEESLMNANLNSDLMRALESLSAEQRMLVVLADIQEMPYQDIADMLGKPVGTIRSRLHRTHKVLRAKLMNNQADDAPKPIKLKPRLAVP